MQGAQWAVAVVPSKPQRHAAGAVWGRVVGRVQEARQDLLKKRSSRKRQDNFLKHIPKADLGSCVEA